MQIAVRHWEELELAERERLLARSEIDISSVRETVETIIAEVRSRKDAAVQEYTQRFDGADFSGYGLRVSEKEMETAASRLSPAVREALEFAVENVRRYHAPQLPEGTVMHQIRPGVYAGERATPIGSVGLYVPRGRGSFPSMLYMLAVPARVAGVKQISITTPPDRDGSIDDACLYAASLCNVSEIYRAGGAQAIAALAYGTESVNRVDKIIGPGSMYVTAAKRLLYGTVDVGLPAGPSESIVLADGTADPWKVALDLLIEAEHGSDSQALVVTPSRQLADAVIRIVPDLVGKTPEPRKTFLTDVLQGYGGIIITRDMETAVSVVNEFAPEHLQIQTADPYDTLPGIQNAGEILLGENTPFTLANYAAGANAVLPTGGAARTFSPVSVRDFMKNSSVVHITASGYQAMKDHVQTLAEYEGFHSHASALKNREKRPSVS
jgi:histidinol dehydrogenase